MIATFRRLAAVCCVAGMSFAGFARADEPPTVERGTGKIVDLTPTRVAIQLKGGERMLELTLNDKTRVITSSNDIVRVVTGTGDVQELRKAIDCKIADLKVDHWVNVRYADGIAVQVHSSMINQDREGEGGGVGPRDGDRPREGDQPCEIRRDGDAPREGVQPREIRRDGDRPREGDARRDDDRPGDGDVQKLRRDGDGPRNGADGASATAASLFVGDIASVDGGKLTITLTRRNQPTGATRAVTIDPTAEIRIEGNAAKAADLRPGMSVSVTVEKGRRGAD